MQIMKSLGLISGVMLLAVALSNNLSAGPVYAAKWEKNGQAVLLYGDDHDTHETDEELELDAIDAFCKELKCAKRTIVLCEDKNAYPFSPLFSDQDCRTFFGKSYDKGFLSLASNFAHALSNDFGFDAFSYVQAESIDQRNMLNLMSFLFQTVFLPCLQVESCEKEVTKTLKKGVTAIRNKNISETLASFSTNVKRFAQEVQDEQAREIFNKIANVLEAQNTRLCKKIVADTGLSFDELHQATINDVLEFMKKDERYAKLAEFLANKDLFPFYGGESVEAEALSRIIPAQKTGHRCVVLAGLNHIRNLEEYLLELGFEQNCEPFGLDYTCLHEEHKMVKARLRNIFGAYHLPTVFPLDLHDAFGQILFKDAISAGEQEFSSNDVKPFALLMAQFACMEKEKILNSFKPVPLIPFDAFKWISEEGDQS